MIPVRKVPAVIAPAPRQSVGHDNLMIPPVKINRLNGIAPRDIILPRKEYSAVVGGEKGQITVS